MIDWIIEPPEPVFEIKKVSQEKSTINIISLIESRDRIGELICVEQNVEKAQRLMQIRKDLNVIINQGL